MTIGGGVGDIGEWEPARASKSLLEPEQTKTIRLEIKKNTDTW